VVFKHASATGYAKASSRSARTRARLGKIKNPAAPAVKREAEEDWGKKRR